MNRQALNYINNIIMTRANKLSYIVKDSAPSTENELFSNGLVIWSGASDNTIFQDKMVNYGFRALHDSLHLKTRIDFSAKAEIELGRIQASKFDSDLIRELIYCEVSLQASHYEKTGSFVSNQYDFTMDYLRKYIK